MSVQRGYSLSWRIWGLLPGLTFTPIYTYTHKFQDHFHGDLGFNYRQLKAETDVDSHSLDVRLAWIPMRA